MIDFIGEREENIMSDYKVEETKFGKKTNLMSRWIKR